MNVRNTNYLNRKFKKFFKHRKDLRQSLMAFGYEAIRRDRKVDLTKIFEVSE